MRTIDYNRAREILQSSYLVAEEALLLGSVPDADSLAREHCDKIFGSATQAFREALLGCVIVRLLDRSINVRLPYVDQGPSAYSGRSLDERVINPFLQEKRVPSSRGPYLSVFRRSVTFDASIRVGLRDKSGYEAFLNALTYLESTDEDESVTQFLRYTLFKFLKLREATEVPLARLQRISLSQYETLLNGLLSTPSGGLFPVLLAVAMFNTFKSSLKLEWEISWQGINVADAASKAGGDITITQSGETILAIEVTERAVDRSRVVATFNNKIAPGGLQDYLFLFGSAQPASEARAQAHQYFAQGHEVNFVEVKSWLMMSLTTVGRTGRATFNKTFLSLLDEAGVPQALRVAWNENINALMGL